jgi:hypothetical protein
MHTNKITGSSGVGNSSSWNRKRRTSGQKEKDGISGQILTNKNYMAACFDVF